MLTDTDHKHIPAQLVCLDWRKYIPMPEKS